MPMTQRSAGNSILLGVLWAGISTVLAGCGTAPSQAPMQAPPVPEKPNYGAWSLRLKERMTEKEVSNILGAAPTKVELSTCGQSLGKPWTCKSAVYGELSNSLSILYERSDTDGLWRVNSWSVFNY
jgi:hypothetical protein